MALRWRLHRHGLAPSPTLQLPTFIKEKHTEVSKERTAKLVCVCASAVPPAHLAANPILAHHRSEAAEAAVEADDAGEEHTEEDEAGGPPLSPSAVQRLQQVFHETQAKVQDTVPVLREQRSAGAETLAAVSGRLAARPHMHSHTYFLCAASRSQLESQRRRAPAAFEEVMAAVPSNPPSSESGGR